jgi:hypothetical protein
MQAAFKPETIRSGFRKSGIWPINPLATTAARKAQVASAASAVAPPAAADEASASGSRTFFEQLADASQLSPSRRLPELDALRDQLRVEAPATPTRTDALMSAYAETTAEASAELALIKRENADLAAESQRLSQPKRRHFMDGKAMLFTAEAIAERRKVVDAREAAQAQRGRGRGRGCGRGRGRGRGGHGLAPAQPIDEDACSVISFAETADDDALDDRSNVENASDDGIDAPGDDENDFEALLAAYEAEPLRPRPPPRTDQPRPARRPRASSQREFTGVEVGNLPHERPAQMRQIKRPRRFE